MPTNPLSVTYATDEDIALRCGPGDFAVIAPRSNKFAAGTDGAIASLSPWLLTSTSTAWVTQGVVPGMVVQLSMPGVTGRPQVSPSPFANPFEMFAVDSVTTGGAALRRLGQATGIGLPPGGGIGITGISFAITSLNSEIEDASYEVNHRIGINELIPGRQTASLLDRRELNQATVLTVLERLYVAAARAANDGADDLFAKAKYYGQRLTDVLDRLIVHWQTLTSSGIIADPVSSRFGTRLSR